jgi:ribose 5-phosphate isomerase A
MNQDEKKKAVAQAALEYTLEKLPKDSIIGIGTGSTANLYIDLLAEHRDYFAGAVSSSAASTQRLTDHGFKVFELQDVDQFSLYVDGADEMNPNLELIKGGGGALTREKIVAAGAEHFLCIVDDTKQVDVLGKFALPVEVIPMAVRLVAKALLEMGGMPELRQGFVTDNANLILDVSGFEITDAKSLETEINQITGVVCNGLFARRPADAALVGTESGVVKVA